MENGWISVNIPHFSLEHGRCSHLIAQSYVITELSGTSLARPELSVPAKDCIGAFERLLQLEKELGYDSIRPEVYLLIGTLKDKTLQLQHEKDCLKLIHDIKTSF
jgi:hypothetical protein